MIDVYIPIKTVSEANNRDHWAVKRKRRLAQQQEVSVALQNVLKGKRRITFPCVVTLTRIGPRALDSHDNLRSALKGVVDAIANKLGIDDGDERISFEYLQKPVGQLNYGVKIQIVET